MYKKGPDFEGGGVDWYPMGNVQRGQRNLYWRS